MWRGRARQLVTPQGIHICSLSFIQAEQRDTGTMKTTPTVWRPERQRKFVASKLSCKCAMVIGALALAALPADAALLRYNFTASFDFSEAPGQSGTASGFFEYEEGPSDDVFFGSFPTGFLTFEITYAGGPIDGRSYSSADGRDSFFQNSSDGSTIITLVGPDDSRENIEFRFGGNFMDRDIAASIDVNDFISGTGFGSVPFDQSLTNMQVTAQLAAVPGPASGVLLTVAAGGAGLLSAATRRRARKRAAAQAVA